MNFYKFLNEDRTFDNIATVLKYNGQHYINEYRKCKDKNLIYRGLDSDEDYIVKSVRKDRRPLDTNIEIHNLVDEYFHKKFNVKLRSESLFGTYSSSEASRYGNIFIIIPLGNFKIYISEKYNDLYDKINI